MTTEINIVPVKFSNLSVLNNIVTWLNDIFPGKINFTKLDLNIAPAYSPDRAQYFSTQIIADAVKLTENIPGKIILLTEVDLYIPVLTFVFGEAQLNGKHSVVSVCRLHEEFYSGLSDDELLIKRAMKEILHELGHNFGLKHCDNWDCVMHASPGIEEVDIKGDGYCNKCSTQVCN